jgi:1,4-alpha-glucan branching enzyme
MWAEDFSPAGFGWIDANDSAGNVVSFLRYAGPGADGAGLDGAGTGGAGAVAGGAGAVAGGAGAAAGASVIACVANFAGEPHLTYRIGLPSAGRWHEVINTDAGAYGGSGVGNMGVIEAVAEPFHGQPASAVIAVPPLGVLWLAPEDPGSMITED